MSLKDPTAPYVHWDDVPELQDPCMIVGFHGWSDAGGVSSDTVAYLYEALQPQVFATISNEPFMNYALDRPTGQISGGLINYVEAMITEVAWCSNADGEHDLVLLLGKEPHFNWVLYTKVVLGIMQRVGANRLCTVGGVQDTVSHTAAPRISIVATSEGAVESAVLLGDGIQAADYYGPVSVHTCLLNLCRESDIEGISLWGHVPAYLQKNPRVVGKMVTIINKMIGLQCPIDRLRMKAVEIDRRINEILAKDPNLKQFVESIEQKKESIPQSGRDKIIRLNDFLRRDPNKDPKVP